MENTTLNLMTQVTLFKGCVRYIFAGLLFLSRKESNCGTWKKLFHFKSSFRSPENQIYFSFMTSSNAQA